MIFYIYIKNVKENILHYNYFKMILKKKNIQISYSSFCYIKKIVMDLCMYMYVLLKKAEYLRTYDSMLIPVPTRESLKAEPGEIKYSSEALKKWINDVTIWTSQLYDLWGQLFWSFSLEIKMNKVISYIDF